MITDKISFSGFAFKKDNLFKRVYFEDYLLVEFNVQLNKKILSQAAILDIDFNFSYLGHDWFSLICKTDVWPEKIVAQSRKICEDLKLYPFNSFIDDQWHNCKILVKKNYLEFIYDDESVCLIPIENKDSFLDVSFGNNNLKFLKTISYKIKTLGKMSNDKKIKVKDIKFSGNNLIIS